MLQQDSRPPEAVPVHDPLFGNDSIGLAVMEAQVLHYGHIALLSWMRATCGKRVVALGSSQLSRQPGHPFTFLERKAMIDAVFGFGAFTFVSLRDIEATVPGDWMSYVMSRLDAGKVRRPTDYFCGSRHDATWYEDAFARMDGSPAREGPGMYWADPSSGRRLRILEREAGDLPSARQIRDLIELRDKDWKLHVPPILWRYVDWHYPPAQRVAVRGESPPEPAAYPVGTLFKGHGPDDPVMVLQDDGKWRPQRIRADEKTQYAVARAAERSTD